MQIQNKHKVILAETNVLNFNTEIFMTWNSVKMDLVPLDFVHVFHSSYKKNNVVIHECKFLIVSLDGWTLQKLWFFMSYEAVTGSFSSCTCNDMQPWTNISHMYFLKTVWCNNDHLFALSDGLFLIFPHCYIDKIQKSWDTTDDPWMPDYIFDKKCLCCLYFILGLK